MIERCDELRGIGRQFRELRIAAGETQADAAAQIGISCQYLSEVEAGTNLTVALVYRFADHYGVPAASVLDDTTAGSST